MSSACIRFFNIQELVDALTSFLLRQDLSRLARTSRKMHVYCTQAFYRELDISEEGTEKRIMLSTFGMAALARNIQYVKKLDLGLDELVYYYNCVLAYQEHCSQAAGPPVTRTRWLPPADPRTCQLVLLPPMLNLTDLTFWPERVQGCPYTMPSSDNPRATLAQICWMLNINSYLTRVDLNYLPIKDLHDRRLLVWAIAGLNCIRVLELSIHCESSIQYQVGMDLFFCCKPSVRTLLIHVENLEDSASSTQDHFSSWHPSSIGEKGDGGGDMSVVPRRQEPLTNLEDLTFWEIDDHPSTTDILSIINHCPNIKQLGIPNLSGRNDIDRIGAFIGQHCPQLRWLNCQSFKTDANDSLPFKVMDALPAQQFQELEYRGLFSALDDPAVTFAIRRHSTTLRRIVFHRIPVTSRMSLSVIFKECNSLTILRVDCSGFYVDLADVIEFPWSCTKLENLVLGIRGCEIPTDPESQPYYSRSAPIVLSEIEKQHFAQLEKLYMQIGRLTELELLSLQMVKLDGQGQLDETTLEKSASFPALLSLGAAELGRPGYLNHLSGLRNLGILGGSVRVDTLGTKETVGWEEVRWMNEHWNQLHYANFFRDQSTVRPPFEWLKGQRQFGRKVLLLGHDC
ncbi:hypothetical protein BGX23_010902 [Mortierella sp. AD031]|nr:hypothetical protein BGX23_010902 [Mortierella sp. AD031]KAG0212309.1 hypothetical protein BGX33_003719 [Mortierella sp. NVP41]